MSGDDELTALARQLRPMLQELADLATTQAQDRWERARWTEVEAMQRVVHRAMDLERELTLMLAGPAYAPGITKLKAKRAKSPS